MNLPASWLKFIYGQQLFWTLRITLGTCIPALWLMALMQMPVQGMAAGVGALSVGILDLPGSLRIKHREMLVCALSITLAGGLTALSLHYGNMIWLAVLAISAIGAYAMNFGMKSAMIGLNCVIVMAMAQSLNGAPVAVMQAYLTGLALGALWYVYFSLLICSLLRHQMQRRALADGLFVTAKHFRARAACYDVEVPLDQARANLLRSQNLLQTAQTQARDLILAELAKQAQGSLDGQQFRLFNLFADMIELYDVVTAAHTDFSRIRSQPCPELLQPLRAMLIHGGSLLERIACAIALGRPIAALNIKTARLRALDQALAKLRAQHPAHPALSTLQDSLQRMYALRRLIAKTVRDTRSETNTSGLDIDQVLTHHSAPSRLFTPPKFWLSGPAPAYALRLALAMAAALCAAKLTGGTHGSWIVMTVAVALRPGFGLSRQRGMKRVQGTLLGCTLATLLLALVHEPHVLLVITIISLLLSLGLATIEYFASVFFTSIMVVLLYHLILPSDSQIASLRLLDTVIGAAIALAMTYVYPYWECRRIRPQSALLIEETLHYLACLEQFVPKQLIEYRTARRNLMAAMVTLAATRDSMLMDPPGKQLAASEVQSLLLWGHLLVALGNAQVQQWQESNAPAARHAVTEALAILRAPADPEGFTPPPGTENAQLQLCAEQMGRLNAAIQQAHA